MKKNVRLTESELKRVIKTVIKEEYNAKIASQLKRAFPNVDDGELESKWENFTKAAESCIGQKQMGAMMLAASMAIPACLLTIFGIVYSFGLISLVSGTGCASSTLIAGKSIYDVAKCIKRKLSDENCPL